MRKNKIIRFFFNKLYRLRLPPMVQYWKDGDSARAKLTTAKDGSYIMKIEGEKYPLYGFPRGPVLFGVLARLKHLAKNLVLNESWKLLEEGKTNEEMMAYLKNVALPVVLAEIEKNKYDFFPPERLCPAVRELWRALTVVEQEVKPQDQFRTLKQGITFLLQEDDAYRFRLQLLLPYLNPKHFWRKLYYFIKRKKYSLREEAKFLFAFADGMEITPDMKGRMKLIERILMAVLEDKEFSPIIDSLLRELNYKKIKMSKSDTYYARGKYLKVDYANYDY